jgi:transcription termination/antitermination protein NusA
VGACVGMRGARVKNIVRELNNEKVDIIRWSDDPEKFIRDALHPIKILTLRVDKERKAAYMTVSEEDLSKAIGRKGQNARLTSRLVGMELNIERDESATEHFDAQVGGAADDLAQALGVERSVAAKLVKGGLLDVASFAGLCVDDVAEVLGDDTELAQHVLDKVASAE